MFPPYCWIVCGFIIFVLNFKFIYLVISEDNLSFYALLLRRIHCISGSQTLLSAPPTHSLIFFPTPSIPNSSVSLGDERRGRFVPQTIWQQFFLLSCVTLCPFAITWRESDSGAGASVLPIPGCRGRQRMAQAPSFALPGSSCHPLLRAEDPACLCVEGLRQ